MGKFWLQVEGQNLSAFVLDTQDLSTARGGSLTLLDAIHALPGHIAAACNLTLHRITTGASIGLWWFEGDQDLALQVANAARTALAGKGQTKQDAVMQVARHGTFNVAVIPEAEGSDPAATFRSTREALVAVARRQQMASANLVYPDGPGPGAAVGHTGPKPTAIARVCSIDLVRPASDDRRPANSGDIRIGGQLNPPLSQSVRDRRGYGMRRKQTFYGQQLKALPAGSPGHADAATVLKAIQDLGGPDCAPFTLQLPSISERPADIAGLLGAGRKLRPNLRGKIAVIYMDGNRFGAIQRQYVAAMSGASTPLQRQNEFDATVQTFRRRLLARLLALVVRGGDAQAPLGVAGSGSIRAPAAEEIEARKQRNENAQGRQPFRTDRIIPFETLLWGGDELMFVVPARFGIAAIEEIIAETASWSIDATPLHHAIGIVFCHHDAPIARINALARRLADHTKSLVRPACRPETDPGWGRSRTLVMPMVLESFDHIGGGLASHLDRRVPPHLRPAASAKETAGREADRDAFYVLEADEIRPLRQKAEILAGHSPSGNPFQTTVIPVSRRKLRRAALAIQSGMPDSDRFSAMKLLDGQPGLNVADLEPETIFRRDRHVLLLEELWDYLNPVLDDGIDEEGEP